MRGSTQAQNGELNPSKVKWAGFVGPYKENSLAVVLCNGIPKSGTHALVRAVQLLGCETEHVHTPYSDKASGKQILITRNPKNTLISWLRFTGEKVTQGFLMGLFKSYDGYPLYDSYARYQPYQEDKDTLIVRFEELFSDGGSSLERVADFIGVPLLDDAYDNIEGLTLTYTGKLSDWRDHWSDLVEAAWIEARGDEVEKLWSY